MALFHLRINGKMTPCFVTQDQKVETLKDLVITPDKKEEFIEAMKENLGHDALIDISTALKCRPKDARKATKDKYVQAIWEKLMQTAPSSSSAEATSTSKTKKQGKKEQESEDEISSDEERRRAAHKAAKAKDKKKSQDEVDELADTFDRVAIEGQSVTTTPIVVKETDA
jgi:hypothetical protein